MLDELHLCQQLPEGRLSMLLLQILPASSLTTSAPRSASCSLMTAAYRSWWVVCATSKLWKRPACLFCNCQPSNLPLFPAPLAHSPAPCVCSLQGQAEWDFACFTLYSDQRDELRAIMDSAARGEFGAYTGAAPAVRSAVPLLLAALLVAAVLLG